jgi:hydroxymethylpyrimidine pyrophosphatase-like HAD family hydrolase
VSNPVRLVASDLDNTLLGVDGVVSERTRRAIEAIDAAGIHVVAATGRSQWTAEPLLAPVAGLDLSVCSNGASLYDLRRRTSLAEHPIAEDVVDAILTGLAEGFPGCLYGWETSAGLHYEVGFIDHLLTPGRDPSPPLSVGGRPAPIRKLMIAHEAVQHYALLDALTPLMPPGCLASTSGAPFVEVTGDGVHKAFGVQQVCERLGIGSDAVVAFGDNHNDLAMLQWAGRGIAVANAQPEVLDAADDVTTTNLDDGVAAVLETLV